MTARLILLSIFIFSEYTLLAQQCGFDDYYLFVVNPHWDNSTQKTDNLKMYLVDENEKPVTAIVTYQENKQWKKRSDTLFFWDNLQMNNKQGGSPLFKRKYYNIGNHYAVVFRLDILDLKKPSEHPIYQLKIEAGEDDLTSIRYPTQVFHLPLQKAVRICNNGVLDDYKYPKQVETLDGKAFKPIDIILNKEQQAEVVEEKSELQYAVRFEYRKHESVIEGPPEYILNTAKVYDTKNGKLHQELYIPSKSTSVTKEHKSIVEFIDFYNRGIAEAKDFSVQIETWRDLENLVTREKTNFYVFNPSSKQYQLDTALSNYDDVFYYFPFKKMRRYEYTRSDKSKVKNTYQLENKQWVLIDRDETLFRPIPPKIKYAPKDCILFNEKSHTLPLKAVIGTNTIQQIKDTFWLYNACEETVYITKVQSATRDFFSINQTLLPKQSTPLIFNGLMQANSFDFTTNNFSCNLTLSDNHILYFGVVVPTVSNNSLVYYNSDSTVDYAIARKPNSRFTNAMFTYPNGNIRAKGMIQDGDTSLKVGNWKFFKDGTWGIDEVVYSREISLTAFDNLYGHHTNFKIRILDNGVWKHPITDISNDAQRFFITNKTDSIVAYTDTTSYAFSLPYNKIPAAISMQFYLLKPNERTLKFGYYQTPFSVLKDQYTIILDHSKFKNKNRTTYQINDSILAALQKKYPKMATVYVSSHQRGIGLQNLNYNEKYKVIMQLTNDSTIAFVCQLFTVMNDSRIAYCDNKVYAEIDIDDADDFKKKALRFGFTDMRADNGSNRYWLTHESKLIDEGFFESYERLTKHPLVLSAHLNTYYEPTLDRIKR